MPAMIPATCSAILTAAYAEARKPTNVTPIWATARKRGRVLDEPADPAGAPAALFDELVDAAVSQRHQGDLGRDEYRLD